MQIEHKLKKCMVCDKEFDGVSRDVCSWQCDEKRQQALHKRLDEAVKNDESHTKKMSKDD